MSDQNTVQETDRRLRQSDAVYPRTGTLRLLRLVLQGCWFVLGWYVGNTSYSLYQLGHTDPSRLLDVQGVLSILLLPGPLAEPHSPLWIYILSTILLALLITGCYWAERDAKRERLAIQGSSRGKSARNTSRARVLAIVSMPIRRSPWGLALLAGIVLSYYFLAVRIQPLHSTPVAHTPGSSTAATFAFSLAISVAVSVLIIVAALVLGTGRDGVRRLPNDRNAGGNASEPDAQKSASGGSFGFIRDTTLATDELEYERFVRTLAATIAQSGTASLAIAIEAEWGRGKTTAMRLLQQMLDTDYHCLTVWFDAWRYRPEEIQRAFLSAIVSEVPPPALHQYLQQRKPLARAILNVIARARNMGDVGSVFADVLDYDMRYRNQLEADFKDIVRYWADGAQRKRVLIIFIDDLDRCSPKGTTQVLEMMKLFANTPGCLFVYGFDPNVVASRIAQDYELPDNDGIEYLRKLIQFEYPLPAIAPERIADFIEKQAKSAGLLPFFDEIDPRVRAPKEYEQYRYKGLIMRETGWNPRKIKLYLNGLVFAAQMAQPEDYLALYYLMLLRFLEPKLYWLITKSVPVNQLNTLLATLEGYVFAGERSGAAHPEQDNGDAMT